MRPKAQRKNNPILCPEAEYIIPKARQIVYKKEGGKIKGTNSDKNCFINAIHKYIENYHEYKRK